MATLPLGCSFPSDRSGDDSGRDATADDGAIRSDAPSPLGEEGDATTADSGEVGDSASTPDQSIGRVDDAGLADQSAAGDESPPPSLEAGMDAPVCTNVCTAGATQCGTADAETCRVQPNGCTLWETSTACGANRMCSVVAGTATCTCLGSICSEAGNVCQDIGTVATCSTDANGCVYVASMKDCTSPMVCAGAAPSAGCSLICTNTCTQGQKSCVSGALATCTLGSNGCWTYAPAVGCGTHESCTGGAGSGTCNCLVDEYCKSAANVCESSTIRANCAEDLQTHCFYESSTATTCTNGACSNGSCCTNACTRGATCATTSSVTLQTCQVGGNGCTASTSKTCTGDNVCERYETAACVDPNWAEWPMPNSAVDVLQGALNEEAYTDDGQGSVTDNVTGLVWQQKVSFSDTYSQADAVTYCKNFTTSAGFTDWRLPSLIELASITDTGVVNPAVAADFVTDTPIGSFWTATLLSSDSGTGWTVDSYDGSSSTQDVLLTNSVRCVR